MAQSKKKAKAQTSNLYNHIYLFQMLIWLFSLFKKRMKINELTKKRRHPANNYHGGINHNNLCKLQYSLASKKKKKKLVKHRRN